MNILRALQRRRLRDGLKHILSDLDIVVAFLEAQGRSHLLRNTEARGKIDLAIDATLPFEPADGTDAHRRSIPRGAAT